MTFKAKMGCLSGIFVTVFCIFILSHSRSIRHQYQRESEQHAVVIEEGIWVLLHKPVADYLRLAAKRDNCVKISVLGLSGEEVLEVEGFSDTGTDKFMGMVGLIPVATIECDIMHEESKIGTLVVLRRNLSIYTYFYTGTLLLLLYGVVFLFVRLVRINRLIEKKVQDRTAQLREEIEILLERRVTI